MKVICAGFWKTGTKSLARALRILGYKVYDYDDQLYELKDLWNKFFDGAVTDDDIREALKDIDVLIDGPVIGFWEEIFKAIPDAKVILTIREEDSWYESFKAMQVNTMSAQKIGMLTMLISPSGHKMVRGMLQFVTYILGVEGPFRLPVIQFKDNPRLYKYKFRQHNCHVMQSVPKDKLLTYSAKDGWGALCKFLEKEVPKDISYPHMNKAGAHFTEEGGVKNEGLKKILARAMVESLVIISVFVGFIAFLFYMFFFR